MRTTLDIDQDVLEAAKTISSRTKRTTGQVLSELARQTLTAATPPAKAKARMIHGFETIPANDRIVTPDLIRALMDESEQP